MKIELLYFDGCPNHRPTAERVEEVLKQEGLAAEIVEVNIQDDATARSAGFLGSPTVRLDGVDVEPSARSSKEFGMMCRTYDEGGNRVGLPSRDLIRTALRESAEAQPTTHDCCQVSTATAQPVGATGSKRKGLFLGASLVGAIGASLCCILPILAGVTGAGAIAAGVAFQSWRPYLLGVTGVLLASGLLLAYWNHKKACAPGSLCATKPMTRWNFVALGIVAAVVVAVAAFPYYSGTVAQVVMGSPTPANNPVEPVALATVTFRVPNMDCSACVVILSASLKRLPGVAEAKLDVESRSAAVSYDPAIQNVAAIEKVISDAGFQISERHFL